MGQLNISHGPRRGSRLSSGAEEVGQENGSQFKMDLETCDLKKWLKPVTNSRGERESG